MRSRIALALCGTEAVPRTRKHPPMERNVEIATGESVVLRYELAGLGSRFFALFIDLTIQVAVLTVAVVLLVWLLPAHPAATLGKYGRAILTGSFIFAIFLLFFGYFIAFEWLWEGRTPGKRALGLRVVRDGGFPLDFTSALIRNLVRIVEAGLGFYAISAVATLLSPRNRRLGDMAAGTLVVRDRRYERAAALAGAQLERDDPLTRELSASQRELVLRFVERRGSLTPSARVALAARIAAGVRPRLGATFAHLDDDALLMHLAETSLG